jgi:hypothetical protein
MQTQHSRIHMVFQIEGQVISRIVIKTFLTS